MKMQHTVRNTIEFSGIGLHTGRPVNVRIKPSDADTGIRFLRKDLPGSPFIKAVSENVVSTSYATTIGKKGASVSTIEHLMAAFYGLGVDNAIVELDGPEVPIMDGSAIHFIEMIESTGLAALPALRQHLVVKKPIRVAEDDKYIYLLPADDMEFTIDYSIDFAHTFLNKQSFARLFSRDIFMNEIASARTFGFLKDVEALRANGLARGGSLENAIVISEDSILNEGGLRYPDEFVRHKVLDMMGDLALVGYPVIGQLVAYRSGHELNHKLAQKVMSLSGRWELSDSVADKDQLSIMPSLLDRLATA